MERLTKRMDENHVCFAICEKECPDGIYNDNPACMCVAAKAALKKLIRYEEMEEQEKLLILPCKPGDTVYIIEDDCEFNGDCHQSRTCKSCEYRNVIIEEDIATLKFIVENIDKFGKTVFLTEQEANDALEGD